MREPRCGVCAALSLLLSGFGVFSSLGHLGLLNLEVLDLEVLSLQGASMNGHAVNLKQQQLRMPLSLSLSLSLSRPQQQAAPQALVHGLRDNRVLKMLWLHENSLSDAGVEVRKAGLGSVSTPSA